MKAKLHYVLSITMLLFIFSAFGQNSSWKKLERVKDSKKLSKLHLDRSKVHFFKLDITSLKKNIGPATSRYAKSKKTETLVDIPSHNGTIETFKIYESSVFAPSLANKYPDIKTYVGYSLTNSGKKLRMSISPQGVYTMVTSMNKGMIFMQPVEKNSDEYVLYHKADKNDLKYEFLCKTLENLDKLSLKSTSSLKTTVDEGGANNQTLQKFRIAISTTAEYTAYHNDGISANGNAVADALAAINTTIGRVNEIFETDMAITFELVDAPQLIYTNATTDPYSDANIGASEDYAGEPEGWNLQLQNTLTSVIENSAYDIGHLFGATGGGGNAGCIGCVCEDDTPASNDMHKGSGFTSPSNGIPEGDTFDIDFVVHEIGHQMGANHTFAFESEGTGVNSEPGSGSTIMGYAGIVGPDNVENNSDAYFHYHSIKQILDNIIGKCQTTENINNLPPTADAGPDYFIPAGTAYILKGNATDSNRADNLTFCWEQIDSGTTNYLNFGPDLATGSMNRSLPPSNSSDRYIPNFSSVLEGKITQTDPNIFSDWETVSNVGRTLNWALTVRDRSPGDGSIGQSSYDTMQITVEDVTPFTVTNPISWAQGTSQEITWEVGETNNGTINCQNVNIKLSTDSGLTFNTTIASNVPNNGSYNYTVPNLTNTTTARILIEAADNIFYDVSDFDFSISNEPEFFMVGETLDPIACKSTSAIFHFNFATANGYTDNTTFSATGNPAGSSVSFSPTSLDSDGTVTMTINNLDNIANDDYTITVTGTSNSLTKDKVFEFPFYNGVCKSIANDNYETSTTGVIFNTINNLNNGKPSGYSDYTNLSTDVNRSNTFDLTVNVNTDGDYSTNTVVWIDWNQNCSFDDDGETYTLGSATNVVNGPTSNSPFSITVPSNAILGNTIMRISTKFAGEGSPILCENGFDGEVEDYSLNIIPTLSIEQFGFDNFNVFPNPNNGTFTIKLNGSLEGNISVDVCDLGGRLIFKNVYKNPGDFEQIINLNQVQTGLYLLKVSDGIRKSTKKIIIK
ncbi:M12 family metallo-peptidase [Aestuariibaculum sp. M13]|uniref:reprolysin-like metallopeptidase n=1 Tax=Aestuariibaculum sp. M13 TaxID=2967132 RepID=UPI002159DB96|nr:zinc-dependent metalloprotease family protein [Aestuariibaculum sp. M13]MCR8667436.1 M12 family metallo-peptidase [Aestuariibaculum sp. M13]